MAAAITSKKPRRKRRNVNKSAAIRAYLAGNPSKAPREIAAELKKDGIVVSAQFVSTVKSTTGKSATKRDPKGQGPKSANGKISLEHLLAAKAIVEKIGDVDAAVAAISVLAKLR